VPRKAAAKKSTAKRTSKKAARKKAAAKGLSIRGYAAHRKALGLSGGSPAAVQKALNDARISRGPDGKIHPEIADAEWEANSNAIRRPKGPSLSQSKAIREAFLAKSARLDYLERVNELVSVDAVRRRQFALWRAVREAILAVPSRCAADAFAAESIAAVEAVMLAELRAALEALADGRG
jgi:hypothetical protein